MRVHRHGQLNRRRAQGISLIEIVVVLAILAVLSVAIAPSIQEALRNAQIRNAAQSIQAGLQRARSEAISRNQNVSFTLVNNLGSGCAASATSGSWIISMDDPTGKCDVAITPDVSTDPRTIAIHDSRDGDALSSVAATRTDGTTASSSITFNSLGRPIDTNQLGRVVLTSPTSASSYRSYQVDVSATGGVRICDKAVSVSSDDPRRCGT